MKKFITVLLSLSMAVSSVGTLAFAEEETASYNEGDLVWSEDFESFDVGYDYEANPTNGIYYSNGSNGTATVKEDSTGNKYLYNQNNSSSGSYIFIVPAGKAAQGDDSIFTVDVDLKLDNVGTTSLNWNFGLGNTSASIPFGSYVTLKPTTSNNANNSGLEFGGTRNVANEFKQTIPGEDIKSNYRRLFANAWNAYRFIARKDADGNYYADMYVNGAYFYQVGCRTGWVKGNQNCFVFSIPANSVNAGVSIDNIKCYYGAVESNDYVTKGEVTVDKYTFDECTAGEYVYATDEGEAEVVAGGNADHAFGVIKRYNSWGMNLDINSGKAGKAEGDNSLSVHSGGRIRFTSVNTDQSGNTAAYSTQYGTWVPEGDSLEFSADVLFKDLKENWLFELKTKADSRRVAIEVTPNFYSTGHWEKPDDFQNHRKYIAPKLPINTWVNLRVIITRGTSDTYNKLTIYADDQVVCKDEEITNWYSSADSAVVTTDAATGDTLAKGFEEIYFHGECDYDNITIKKYLLRQPVPQPETAPVLVNTSTKIDDYPSLRGKVYTDGRTIQSVIDAFGITGDYTVRDANGNTVTDYTKTADGNYIEIFANGKKYYGAFAANNVLETITETTGELGGFTTGSALTAEAVTKGYGRDGESILIKNSSTAEEFDDTQRFIKTLDTDENAYMEFSFLADENTDLYVGYTVYYVRTDGKTEGYSTKVGASRSYNENIHIANNIVKHENSDTAYKTVGSYKNGEWTKLRLEWNSMNNNCVAVSINDGTPVLLNAGIPSYFKTIRTVSITPAANTSAVLDDIVVMEGYKAAPTAAEITNVTENYVYNVDNTLSIPADYSNILASVQPLENAIEIDPLAASRKWIMADGTEASDVVDEVDKLVLVNDGVYTYYTVKIRDGITQFGNDDGTTKIVVDVTSDITDLTGAKLISAVYNTEDDTLVSTDIKDLTFEEDTYTCEIDITPQSFDSKTQYMKYFAWIMNNMTYLCDSADAQ